MRGIGKGQTIKVLVPPEVEELICTSTALALGQAPAAYTAAFGRLKGGARTQQLLKNVVGWLNLNTMRSELLQFGLLCEQSLSNVWRKVAFNQLVQSHANMGTDAQSGRLTDCMNVFRERIHFDISNVVPNPEESRSEFLGKVEQNRLLLETDAEKQTLEQLLVQLGASSDSNEHTLDTEQEQEQGNCSLRV